MKIGFMPDFGQNIFSEVDFGRENFDFIEITLDKNLNKYSLDYVKKLKKHLGNFKVIGHIHWEINILDKKGLTKIGKTINILKKLGAKEVVIHPYNGKERDFEKLKGENISSLQKINDFFKRNKIKLLIENKDKPPFNTAKSFQENFPKFNITLDIGHAKRTSSKEVDNFLKLKSKIKHVHLHDARKGSDHIAFRDKKKLKEIVKKIKKANPKATITLEMFRKLKNNKLVPLEKNERRKVLIKQLNIIK